MPDLDVAISADLQDFLQIPPCSALKLPNPRPLKITLPGGATLSAFSDLSKGIPTDCSLTFSLLLQVAPFLASIECLVKVLKFVKAFFDALNGVKPTEVPSAILSIVKSAGEVVDCALAFTTPKGLIDFIHDLLCLIIKVLNCFLGQMKTLAGILGGIAVRLNDAQAAGNAELVATLECARDNALIQAGQMTASIEPIGLLLGLAGDLMRIAQFPPIAIPPLVAPTDLDGLNQVIQTIQGVVATLEAVVEPLGGCQ
jgi:hypothetical protein